MCKAGRSWEGNRLFLGKSKVVIHHFHRRNLGFLLFTASPAVLFFYLSTGAMISSPACDLSASFKTSCYFLHKCHKWAHSTSHYPAHQVKNILLPIYDWVFKTARQMPGTNKQTHVFHFQGVQEEIIYDSTQWNHLWFYSILCELLLAITVLKQSFFAQSMHE